MRALYRKPMHRVFKHELPLCGAKCRDGHPCQARAAWDADRVAPRNGRCLRHGGVSTGPRSPEGGSVLRRRTAGGHGRSGIGGAKKCHDHAACVTIRSAHRLKPYWTVTAHSEVFRNSLLAWGIGHIPPPAAYRTGRPAGAAAHAARGVAADPSPVADRVAIPTPGHFLGATVAARDCRGAGNAHRNGTTRTVAPHQGPTDPAKARPGFPLPERISIARGKLILPQKILRIFRSRWVDPLSGSRRDS
jgi:hypothetical protein